MYKNNSVPPRVVAQVLSIFYRIALQYNAESLTCDLDAKSRPASKPSDVEMGHTADRNDAPSSLPSKL